MAAVLVRLSVFCTAHEDPESRFSMPWDTAVDTAMSQVVTYKVSWVLNVTYVPPHFALTFSIMSEERARRHGYAYQATNSNQSQ